MLLPLEPLVDVALEPVVDVPAEPVTGALGATVRCWVCSVGTSSDAGARSRVGFHTKLMMRITVHRCSTCPVRLSHAN
jgi:hypothetical protein